MTSLFIQIDAFLNLSKREPFRPCKTITRRANQLAKRTGKQKNTTDHDAYKSVLVVVNDDPAGVEVADGGEGLPGEVEGGGAPGRRAAVDDLDGDRAAVAGVGHGVGAPDATHRVHPPARTPAVPQPVACRRDHRPLVLEPVARRRCTATVQVTKRKLFQ